MNKILLALVLLLSAAAAFGQSDSKKNAIALDIETVLNDQVSAWNAGDIDGFMVGYWSSDEMRFASGNSVSIGWQTALDRYKRNYDTREKMGKLSFSELKISVLTEKYAYVFGRWTLERKEDKPTGLFTLIFVKTDKGWKVVHDHTSS